MVALKHKHRQCAALLNPTSAEPMVWPSPLKFISELNQEAKNLLEQALMEVNREREKTILKGVAYSVPSPPQSDAGTDDNISEDYSLTMFLIGLRTSGHKRLLLHSQRITYLIMFETITRTDYLLEPEEAHRISYDDNAEVKLDSYWIQFDYPIFITHSFFIRCYHLHTLFHNFELLLGRK